MFAKPAFRSVRFLLTGLLVWGGTGWSTDAVAYEFPTKGGQLRQTEATRVLNQISKGVSDLSAEASKAVVFVSISKTIKGHPFSEVDPFEFFFGPRYRPNGRRELPERKMKGLGSGFIVDMKEGYIITNNHVVEGADEISLKLANNTTYDGRVIGRDKNTDVAVVRIKDKNFNRKGLKALRLGDSDKLSVGQLVLALGAPFGLESSISFGVISAMGRGNLNITNLGNFLQTDAAINPGNSGGPLLGTNGKVIGMNTAIYSRSGASAGIGFAVPSNLLKNIALQLINKGNVARGYLGVRLQALDEDLAAGLNLPKKTRGALVAQVQVETPAAKAGLEEGDVIVSVDGKKIKNSSELSNRIGLLSPGSTVKLEVLRDGKPKKISVQLAAYPNEFTAADKSGNTESLPAGMRLLPVDPQKGSFRKYKNQFNFTSSKGLLVLEVAPGTSGDSAGIRPGDVLLKANKKALKAPKDFYKIYKNSKKVLVQLEREGNFLFASIRK